MNPFVYDKPLPPGQLIDRAQELAQLLSITGSGVNCLLASPRRYGKTTLLRRVLVDAENGGTPVAYVDLDGARTLDAVTEAIDSAYRPLKSWGRRLHDVARGAGLTISAGLPFVRGSAGAGAPAAGVRALKRALDIPRAKQRKGGARCLVVFDEFQNVLAVSAGAERLDGLIRSVIQHHADIASYIFAGSEPSLMAELFGNRQRPLFGQARPVELPPLPDDAIAEYLKVAFAQTNRDIGAALRPLLEFVRGHPQRAMLMAHFVWERTSSGTRADAATWRAALSTAVSEHARYFNSSWDGLGVSEQEALRAVARGQPAATFVVERMVSEGQLLRDRGAVRLVDPLYAAWLRDGEHAPRATDKATAEQMLELLRIPVPEWPQTAQGFIFDRAATVKNLTVRERLVALSQGELTLLDRDRRAVILEIRDGLGITRAEAEELVAQALG